MKARLGDQRGVFGAIGVTVLLVACGPSSFAGRYRGDIVSSITCSDGSGGPATVSMEWVVSQVGVRLTLTANDTCSPVTGTASGDVAHLDPKDCGSRTTADGARITTSLQSGTFTLTSTGDVDGRYQLFHDFTTPSGFRGSCNTLATGRLIRQL